VENELREGFPNVAHVELVFMVHLVCNLVKVRNRLVLVLLKSLFFDSIDAFLLRKVKVHKLVGQDRHFLQGKSLDFSAWETLNYPVFVFLFAFLISFLTRSITMSSSTYLLFSLASLIFLAVRLY